MEEYRPLHEAEYDDIFPEDNFDINEVVRNVEMVDEDDELYLAEEDY